jgi:hypothetical protein
VDTRDRALHKARELDHCGAALSLAPRPIDSRIGIGCATLCETCWHRGRSGKLEGDFAGMARRIPVHAAHLGVSVDELVAATGTLGARQRRGGRVRAARVAAAAR